MRRGDLTPAEIKRIKDWHEQRRLLGTAKKIARDMGLSQATIFAVIRKSKEVLA